MIPTQDRARPHANECGLLCSGSGDCGSFILNLSTPFLGRAFDSPLAAATMHNAAWGIASFPLNKVLISYLNGLRHMKAFSVMQSLRYIIVMLWVGVVSASELRFETVAYSFLVAELATSLSVVVYLLNRKLIPAMRLDLGWTKRHFMFGGKSLLSGIFVELNSRVDVLLIGLFLSDHNVGIYSFAAMLVDGLYHVLAMVRINYNPLLVSTIRDGDWTGAQGLLRQTKRIVLPVTFSLSLIIVTVFWVLTSVIVPEKGLDAGLLPLCILVTAMTSISVFVPFDNLMLVSGHPGLQTVQHLTLVFSNIGLNYLMIPLLGINGAAIATSTSYIIGIMMLIFLARRLLGWNLVTNAHKG